VDQVLVGGAGLLLCCNLTSTTGASGGQGRRPCTLQGISSLDPFGVVLLVCSFAGVTGRDRRPATRLCGNATWG